MDRFAQIDTFCRISRVSRETITSLEIYENNLIKANKSLNLIGKSTIDNIWHRHFLDSYQVIDFIEENTNSLADLGSGAGFPGLIIALISKDRKMDLKIKLVEKSPKKAKFLNEIIKKLHLRAEIFNEDIFLETNNLNEDVIVARAFKPLEKIFELIHKKAKNWKKIIILLGKSGKNELLQASKSWYIQYKQRMSVTSSDSIVIEINKLNKK